MEFQKLGRTELNVSAIGIGTEHLRGQPRKTVVSVIREAIERGVNYFDLIFAFPEYLDHLREAFQDRRDQVHLTAHLGSTDKNGQYFKSRSVSKCETFFLDFLSRAGTDYVDVLFLHNFNSLNDWDKIVKPRGVLELALRLREEGKARFIGLSGHFVGVMEKAIESGHVDVVMFPVNMMSHAMSGRRELQDLCAQHDVGLVAMKPFGGGKLLTQRGTFRVPKYQTAGESYKLKITSEIAPAQCLSYALAQVGASMALPGVKTSAELAQALHWVDATEEERDYSHLLTSFGRYVEGECVYCNHCLPCPVFIDIGQIHRLVDAAQWGVSERLRSAYRAEPVTASACTECGACTTRCPFGVDVVPKMREAIALFEP